MKLSVQFVLWIGLIGCSFIYLGTTRLPSHSSSSHIFFPSLRLIKNINLPCYDLPQSSDFLIFSRFFLLLRCTSVSKPPRLHVSKCDLKFSILQPKIDCLSYQQRYFIDPPNSISTTISDQLKIHFELTENMKMLSLRACVGGEGTPCE